MGKVYHLKQSTHREQYRHMRDMLDFKRELQAAQLDTDTQAEKCIGCGGEVEKAPMYKCVCYACYLAGVRPQSSTKPDQIQQGE